MYDFKLMPMCDSLPVSVDGERNVPSFKVTSIDIWVLVALLA